MGNFGYKGSAWPQEKIDQLISLHQEGYSAGIIAERMGMSRDAVIGKCWRLGLSFERVPSIVKKARAITSVLTNAQLASLAEGRLRRIQQAKQNKEVRLTKFDIKGVTIHELKFDPDGPTNCRAILHRDGIDTLYCGKPVYKRSYCSDHFRKFYCLTRAEQRGQVAEGQ